MSQYQKTIWNPGRMITDKDMNKIEDALIDQQVNITNVSNNLQHFSEGLYTPSVEEGALYLEQLIPQMQNSNNIKCYSSIAAMKADTSLAANDYVRTLGYYEANDGGAAEYIINDDAEYITWESSLYGTKNETWDIELNNGKFAKMLYHGKVNIKQFGATDTIDYDESSVVQNAINYVIAHKGGQVYFNAAIRIDTTVVVDPTAKYYKLELLGDNAAPHSFAHPNQRHPNHYIIRKTAGVIFAVNCQFDSIDEEGNLTNWRGLYQNDSYRGFAVRNLYIYVAPPTGSIDSGNAVNNVTAFLCIQDTKTVFENLFFFKTQYSIRYNTLNDYYCDYITIKNCTSSYCSGQAFVLGPGDNKSIINCSVGADRKVNNTTENKTTFENAISLTACRDTIIENFMFNGDPMASTNGITLSEQCAIIRENSGCTGILSNIYIEEPKLPIIYSRSNSKLLCQSIYIKYLRDNSMDNVKDLFIAKIKSLIEIKQLQFVEYNDAIHTFTTSGDTDSIIKINDSNRAIVSATDSSVILSALNELLIQIVAVNANEIKFVSTGGLTSSAALSLFTESSGMTFSQFKLGNLVGVEIVSQKSDTKLNAILNSNNGITFSIDTELSATIATNYLGLIKFYYLSTN